MALSKPSLTRIPKAKVDKKTEELGHLDTATQEIINRLNNSDRRFRTTRWITLLVVLTVGVAGILYQVHVANQSRDHIDCIIKDLSTPQAPGTTHKYIDVQSVLSKDCKIRFTK